MDHKALVYGPHAVLDGIFNKALQGHQRQVDLQRGGVDLALALKLRIEAQGLYA
ncbi:hypothetical protein D3C86_1977780 [compost metagenome]